MRRILGVMVVAFLMLPLSLKGQERSPELQKLDHWVGEWTSTTPDGSNPTGICKWLGNSFVHCESEGPEGAILWVMGYDADEGAYTTSYFGDGGSGTFDTVTLEDDTMTWLIRGPEGGQFRGTWVMESQDVMTYKAEIAEEGGDWVVQAEIRMTRGR